MAKRFSFEDLDFVFYAQNQIKRIDMKLLGKDLQDDDLDSPLSDSD